MWIRCLLKMMCLAYFSQVQEKLQLSSDISSLISSRRASISGTCLSRSFKAFQCHWINIYSSNTTLLHFLTTQGLKTTGSSVTLPARKCKLSSLLHREHLVTLLTHGSRRAVQKILTSGYSELISLSPCVQTPVIHTQPPPLGDYWKCTRNLKLRYNAVN